MNAKAADRSYKRSWKNLLINKRYQLRFTLFMVGLSSLLMIGLGIWVMRVANETTEVSMTSVRGDACPRVPAVGTAAPDEEPAPRPSMRLEEPSGETAANDAPVAAPSEEPKPEAKVDEPGPADVKPEAAKPPLDPETRRVNVQLDESSMTLTPTVPGDYVELVVAHWTCELRQADKFGRLEHGRRRILWAMILTGIALVVGLALYGIKMTHRVAGPLFKVSLYLSKMRGGRYDKVYNLRKGDQLIEFYDHFKAAHGGVVAMQREDIAKLAEVIAAAEAAGAGSHPVVAELRDLLARKEKSVE